MDKDDNSLVKKPPVVSYIRWSTGGQKLGDSERRQLESSRKWLIENGYEVDENIVLEDSGLSGFHRENFSENSALSKFIEKVKKGQFPKGTKLVIEDFSRFSRAELPLAQEKFLQLINNDIHVVIVKDRVEYSKENYKFTDMIVSLAKMESAHEESARKSLHLNSFWENRRKKAKENSEENKEIYPVLLPSSAPDWLRKVDINGQKHFEIIEERQKVIEYIFELADTGGIDGLGLGSTRIVRVLEKKGIEPFIGERKNTARTFNDSYVLRLFNDRRIIGELQPYKNPINKDTGKRIRIKDGNPIPDYFPQVIDIDTYNRVQQKIKQRKTYFSGKISNTFSNIFTKIVKCHFCGSPMTLFQKRGSKAEGGMISYLQCSEGTKLRDKEKCGNKSVRYSDTFEKTLISTLVELDLSPLFKTKVDKDDSQKIDIRNQIYKHKTQLDKINIDIKNVSRLQVKNPDDESFDEIKMELREEKNKIDEQIETLNQELITIERNNDYDLFRNNLDFVLNSVDLDDDFKTYTKRRAINTYLMDIIQYIAIDGVTKNCWIVFDLGFVKEELLASFMRGENNKKNLKPKQIKGEFKIGDIAPEDDFIMPSDTQISAFGTNAVSAHIKVKLHRFNVYQPDTMDTEILREAYDIAPPSLIKINRICDNAINRNWKHLRRKHFQVLDQNKYEEIQNSLFDQEFLSQFENEEDIENLIKEEENRLNKT
jgi:DNA invertase Pin-like site-specific DNA recombinase